MVGREKGSIGGSRVAQNKHKKCLGIHLFRPKWLPKLVRSIVFCLCLAESQLFDWHLTSFYKAVKQTFGWNQA